MTTQAVHEARRTRWPSALGLASVHCAQLQRVQGSSASCVVLFGLFTIMHNNLQDSIYVTTIDRARISRIGFRIPIRIVKGAVRIRLSC